MSGISFREKWQLATQHSKIAVGIAPRVINMPAPIMRYDDPFLPFGRAIIEATADLTAAYTFDMACYLALGAAGARALERTIPIVPRHIPVILHAPFSTADYFSTVEAFGADAVTLQTDNLEIIHAYTHDLSKGAFIPAAPPDIENIGQYHNQGFTLDHQNWIKRVIDEVIYASGMDNFAEKAREALQSYNQTGNE